MISNTFFTSKSYREALELLILSRPKRGRGTRIRLAEALRCQPTQISQVLAGKTHLTLEQAESATRFFALSEDQREFFIAMASRDRAASESLRQFYQEKLDALREKYLQLENLVSIPQPKEIDQSRYYQSWLVPVVHMAGLIPKLNSAKAIATRFHVSIQQASEAIEFLVAQNLAVGSESGFTTVQDSLFLSKNSPYLTAYHLNWRANAMAKITQRRHEDLHFTAVAALSRPMFQRVTGLLRDTLKACTDAIKEDPNGDDVFAISIDTYLV